MKSIVLSLLIIFISFGQNTKNESKTLKPEKQHPYVNNIVRLLLTQQHYEKKKVNDEFSEKVYDKYLSTLDLNRSLLLKEDVEAFEVYRFTFDDYLKANNLHPAYRMFNRFKEQRIKQVTYQLSLLNDDIPEFTSNENYQYDREDAEWLNTDEELTSQWNKQFRNDVLNLKLSNKKWENIQSLLKKRYSTSLKHARQYNDEDVFSFFLNAFTGTFDPHTSYMSPKRSEDFKINMSLGLEGIGAQLTSEGEFIKINRIIPGGPADKGKELQANDKITGVAQGEDGKFEDIIGWRIDDAVQLIRGKKGSIVRLSIIPNGASPTDPYKIVRIVRDKVKLEEQAAKSDTLMVESNGKTFKLGRISIPSFYLDFEGYNNRATNPNYKGTTRDVKKLISELKEKNIDGLIIDLRSNGGGSLIEAVNLTGLFIDKGPVVQIKNQNGEHWVNSDTDPKIYYDGPLSVMVNRSSASASEIFSAAIQDYGRGLIVGTQTYGKGTVQTLAPISKYLTQFSQNLGQLKLTIQKFYRINGGSTQHRGVIPDINFPSLYNSADYGESALETALPYDMIEPSNYKKAGNISGLIPQLKLNHSIRVKNDIEYQLLIETIAEYDKRRSEISVSLNEDIRKLEREKREATKLRHKNIKRVAQGLTELSKDDKDDKKLIKKDVLLDETGYILADLILLESQGGLASKEKE